jgi:hypothetical protein
MDDYHTRLVVNIGALLKAKETECDELKLRFSIREDASEQALLAMKNELKASPYTRNLIH